MNSANVRHEYARFSENVCSEVPRIAGRRRKHRALADVVDMSNPFAFGVKRRFDRVDLVIFQML